jgi:hypothetical protein
LSHGTCSYIYMYINAVADSVMLYLHDFYNIIFKLYVTCTVHFELYTYVMQTNVHSAHLSALHIYNFLNQTQIFYILRVSPPPPPPQ